MENLLLPAYCSCAAEMSSIQ